MRKGVISVLLVGVFLGCDQLSEPEEPTDAPDVATGRDAPVTHGVVASAGLLPDLRTVVPQALRLEQSWNRELLRFTNGMANTGRGRFHIKPQFPQSGTSGTQDAIQQIFDANGRLVQSRLVSRTQFHPAHNHWHIAGVAQYQIRSGSLTGPVVRTGSKTTFCLIDLVQLAGFPSPATRRYTDCTQNSPAQGISRGWVDEYGWWLDGQDLDITGAPLGVYYLISRVNPARKFIEANYANNRAWVEFRLYRDSMGHRRIRVLSHSPCTGGLCGGS